MTVPGFIGRQWQEFREDYDRWGLLRSLHRLTMRAVDKLFGLHVAIVLRRPLRDNIDPPAPAPGYEVRVLTDADYQKAVLNPELDLSYGFIEHALNTGGFCMGAFKDDELVAYVWRAFGDAPGSSQFRLRVTPPLRYGYKALTLPAHRGLRLQSSISLASDQTCIDRGYTTGASYIETDNYASIRSDRRRGAKVVGWIAWLSKGQFRWCYASPGARRFGLTLYDPLKSSESPVRS